MLVLNRKPFQKVQIGDEIQVWCQFRPDGRVMLFSHTTRPMTMAREEKRVSFEGQIEVKILRVRGRRITLGISANKAISILREELLAPKQECAA
ncbi:carbon storage regulator, CsrA [Oceanospirillum multiglobuliferum]|uniref:Carbon storage regulator n=1 Tax=Oceanospirillum multiglobuliferum TaxID=64969 RepID=A0A1T4QYT5_9GAMM|nr:carbon storage regulator [Oceanospirillum multiglobuliferum]OPX57045.1 hypothetical protein BTE48_01035 [Oceanospirillum multiglobuliferum]SKA08992.1 carbon storage regulator, CsrA [Oceanospirillum multiglobuliferum]